MKIRPRPAPVIGQDKARGGDLEGTQGQHRPRKTQAPDGCEGHAPQTLAREQTREGIAQGAGNMGGREYEGRLISVGHGVAQNRQGERQAGRGARLAPAMAATQTFGFDALACDGATLDAQSVQSLFIGANGVPASAVRRGSGGNPDMPALKPASARQRRKIEPLQRRIPHRFRMSLKRRAVPVKADDSALWQGRLEHT